MKYALISLTCSIICFASCKKDKQPILVQPDILNRALYKNRNWHITYHQSGDNIKDSGDVYSEAFAIKYLSDRTIEVPAFSLTKLDTLIISPDTAGGNVIVFNKQATFYNMTLRYYKELDSVVINYSAIKIHGGHKYDYYDLTAWAK